MEYSIGWEAPLSLGHGLSLNGVTVSTLVQAGVKMFLHQRNQIPLPFEHLLQKRAGQVKGQGQGQGLDENRNDDVDDDDVKKRIQFRMQQRKIGIRNRRLFRQAEKALKKEASLVEEVTKGLRMLDLAITQGMREGSLLAVGLFFGTSVHNSRESVFFDLSRISGPSGSKSGSDPSCQSIQKKLDSLVRSFYKSIITSEEFCDFTSKTLPPSRIHICLLTKKQLRLEEDEDSYSLVLLENTDIFEKVFLTSDPCTTDSAAENELQVSRRKKLRGKKSLKIQMSSNSSFSSSFSESLFCYQIPSKLKGIRSKNS